MTHVPPVAKAGVGRSFIAARCFKAVAIVNKHPSAFTIFPDRFRNEDTSYPNLDFGTIADQFVHNHLGPEVAIIWVHFTTKARSTVIATTENLPRPTIGDGRNCDGTFSVMAAPVAY